MIAQSIINDLQLPETIKEIICKEGNRSKVIYDLLLRGEISITSDKMLELAIIDGNKELFYTIVDSLDDDINLEDWNRIASCAAKGGHIDIVDDMIARGDGIILDDIAYYAAKGGHKDMVMNMIAGIKDKDGNIVGVKNWNWIAFGAAKGGHKEIVDDMIRRGADDWDLIADGAVQGGNKDILNELIKLGAKDYDISVRIVRKNGQHIIVKG